MRKALSLMLMVTMLLGSLAIPQPAWSQEVSDPALTREEAPPAASEPLEASAGLQDETSQPGSSPEAPTGPSETPPVVEAKPAAETTPATPTEAKPAAEPAASQPPATTSPYLFAGILESFEEGRLRVRGQGPDGEDLTLEFATDEHSQVVDGLKASDRVSVLYEVVEGGYVVVSARFAEGELPANRFPAPATATTPATSTPAPDAPAAPEAPAEEQTIRVVSIEIEGNQKVPTEEILQVVSTRIGDPLLEPRIRRDMQAIFDIGYFTDVRLDTRYAPGGVRLVFRVLENPVVSSLEITGNQVVPTEKILELMDTEVGQILNTRVLHADLQNINKYYNEDLGYLLTPTHVTELDFTEGRLLIRLTDGMVVKGIEIKGVSVFPEEKVRELVKTAPGDLFNRNVLREDSERISALYEKKDYILDTIRPSLDAETGMVTLNVVEAELEEVRVEGNTRTKTETITRNVRTRPGEVLQRKKLQRDLERLNNLGYFKKVEPEIEPGSEPGKVVLVLKVEEQKTGLATIGVGYAGGGSGAVRAGVTGTLSYSDRNLFGEGKSASVNLQQGADLGTYGISYYDPAINKAQDSIGVSLYYSKVDNLQQAVLGAPSGTFSLYEQKVYGGTLTYGHPFTDDFRGFINLRRETIDLSMDSDSQYVPVGMGKGDLNSIGLASLYDTRDDVFNPHDGIFGNASLAFAGGVLGGDYDYTKLLLEGRYYLPLSERSTLALRAMYGAVGNKAPASEYFYAGGTDTMRAYRDNSYFGTHLLLFNAEYRFPIANIKMLSGAIFADAGNAWFPGYTTNKLYTDAGIGLRIVFPTLGLGVIRIDYAFGQDGSRSSIGIGQSF
ncbi:MAG: POTRA domain-containing protein [Candidatus Xenobium sp.]|jgi:outer membrane protein insertion porin family|nr:BamA/TamA family outer membrane protein [Burkholderiales bacterium]